MVSSMRLHLHTAAGFIANEEATMFYALSWFAVVALLAFWSRAV